MERSRMESKEYAARMQAAAELLLGENMEKQRLNADDVQRMLRWNTMVANPSPAVTATYGTLLGLQTVVGQPWAQRLEGMHEYPRHSGAGVTFPRCGAATTARRAWARGR